MTMRDVRWNGLWLFLILGIGCLMIGCGSDTAIGISAKYILTVNSTNPAAGAAIGVSPTDTSSATAGPTGLNYAYDPGTTVTLTAPATWANDPFVSWSGCTPAGSTTCKVTVNSNTTVTANYTVSPPTTTAYTLTVNSGGASGVAIGVSPADNNSATNGATSFTRTYNAGTSVTLIAPATSGGDTFTAWSGCTTVSSVTCTVALNANATVSANYAAPAPPTSTTTAYTLTVNSGGASGVAIGVSPADNNSATNGATSFTRTYDAGTSVTLTAPAASGADTFTSWSGCTTVSSVTCTVALNANATVSANYAAPAPPSNPITTAYTLTVNSGGASGVAVGVSPADNNSAANGITTFMRTYSAGAAVTLTAPATSGGDTFTSWSGCATASSTTCMVTLNADTTVSANYVAPVPPSNPITAAYTLTVNSGGVNGVAIGVSPADNNSASDGATAFTRTYSAGAAVTLTAPATSGGDTFTSWSGCANASSTVCMIVLNANTTVSANYVAPAPPSNPPTTAYTLMVSSSVASGVAIGVSPADNDNATNGTTSFTRTYNAGALVTLTAPSTSGGDKFSSWSGCTMATSVTCTVALNANTTVSANYTAPPLPPPTPPTPTFVLTVNSTNPSSGVAIGVLPADNSGTKNGTSSFKLTYNAGTAVTLTAPSTADGDPFIGWTGCATAKSVTCTVTLNANTTVSASYVIPPPTPATYVLTVNSSGVSSVAIDVSPEDNKNSTNGTTDFTRIYNTGTVVTLTAPATSGSDVLTSWTGCETSSTVTCTVAMTGNMTVVANYTAPPPTTYTVTVNSTTPATGVPIGVAPADNNSKANGTTSFVRTYNAGTAVTLTAPATANSNTFASWSGCTATSSVACTIMVNSNKTVTANYVGAAPASYELTVDSVSPASGIAIGVTPADNNNATNGATSFKRTYNMGTSVTLTAPATSGGDNFVSWSGCTAASSVTCQVTMNSSTTVTATYDAAGALSVSVTPNPATVIIGTAQQFTAVVSGTGSSGSGVTWSLSAPSGSSLSPGTLSSTGLYTTPYPAPSTVTITATSTQNTSVSGSVTVSLVAPAAASGPGLTVDAGNQTRSISPYIYGMNAYELDFSAAKTANIPLTRWGGDAASRYNYQVDATNTAADYYFENRSGNTADGQDAVSGESSFNALVDRNKAIGAATLGTVPVLGWVAKDSTSCSYPTATYANQYSVDPYEPCGDGQLSNQTLITSALPTATSVAAGPPWVGDWVGELVNTFGTAANGGVSFYDLDNEPNWWDANHRDVHPDQATYDELTNNGIATAEAVKAADPTAEVNGPVVDFWWSYFYSKKDILSGWDSPPCYSPWDNPVDREAHGGVPFAEYYLQQFAAYQAAHNVRLLDYLDLHGYFAASYPVGSGNSVDLTTAGDTGEQQARVNSTRALWDPTYTDPAYPQPNYSTDANYTTNCATPLQAPQLIPMMHAWIANSYPGTKTSISEYNWGGQESINGAVAQADVLGIFGSYGLDMATLWGPPNPTTQVPGLVAYEVYRNYDGNNSLFGNQALASVSTNQGTLSVYGALRTADNKITIVVINKTYGDLTSTISLANLTATPGQTAQAFLYSNANLAGIVAEPAVAVAPPPSGGTTSTLSTTFPAQSITLFILSAN